MKPRTTCCRRNFSPRTWRFRNSDHAWRSAGDAARRSWRARANLWAPVRLRSGSMARTSHVQLHRTEPEPRATEQNVAWIDVGRSFPLSRRERGSGGEDRARAKGEGVRGVRTRRERREGGWGVWTGRDDGDFFNELTTPETNGVGRCGSKGLIPPD